MTTLPVVLDYCGGSRTDKLVENLREWNPGYTVNVLDNASPRNQSRYITHRNATNSYPGGGITDCLNLATRAGAKYLLFIANDVECTLPVNFGHMETLMLNDDRIVQVSASITPDTSQAKLFPWMLHQPGNADRIVPHADLLLSFLDIRFITDFGGFPASKGGWYYDWEIAFHARQQSKLVIVTDSCAIRHDGTPQDDRIATADEIRAEKRQEAQDVYRARYGDLPGHNMQTEIARNPAMQRGARYHKSIETSSRGSHSLNTR